MKNTTFGIFFILSLLVVCFLCNSVIANRNDQIKYFEEYEFDNVVTGGPITSTFDVFDIEFIDGNPDQIQQIERLLDPTYSRDLVRRNSVEVTDLDFSITYHWDNYIKPVWKFQFFTTFVNYDRFLISYFLNVILGKNHVITVQGFNGDFWAIRPLFKFLPGSYCFWGEYELVTINKL